MNRSNNTSRRFFSRRKFVTTLVAIAVVVFLVFGLNGGSQDDESAFATAEVARGDMVISVLEAGNVESSESLVIKCQVEGRTTIISIVPEGTILTEEDVAGKKVLVELDSSDLRDKEAELVISVEGESASFTDAKESYDIQVKQNESNENQGKLDAKFALIDLEKYLGEELAYRFIEEKVELSGLVDSLILGGEALQTKRELANEIKLASEEKARAEDQLLWTQKLEAKGYVTRSDLQADELALERRKVALEQAITALELFERYEFKKQAEKLRSDFEEANMELERIIAKNRAELSKAKAKLNSASATYVRKAEELNRVREQIKNCTLVATKPGLVVYAGSDHPWHGTQIEEGAEVHERQEILKIPSSTSMIAKTKVHESIVARVEEGQKAIVTVGALPDEVFYGAVTKVGIVPDSQNRWWNPDLKVYLTDVSIEGNHPDLKPGMSAQVKIIIEELKDILKVPVEAVSTLGEDKVCFVTTASGPEKRTVQTGDYDDAFIEITGGLEEGEAVILNPSDLVEKSKPRLPEEKEVVAEVDFEPKEIADADR